MNRLLRKKLNFSQFLQRQPLREFIIKVKEFKEEKNPECLLERVLKSLSILNPTQREKTKAISAKLEKLKMYQSMKTEWFKLGMQLHQSLQHDSFMFCSKAKSNCQFQTTNNYSKNWDWLHSCQLLANSAITGMIKPITKSTVDTGKRENSKRSHSKIQNELIRDMKFKLSSSSAKIL